MNLETLYKFAHGALGHLIIALRKAGHEDAADACTFALDMVGKSVTRAMNGGAE